MGDATYSQLVSYKLYTNKRFGYSIEYPSFLNYNGEENKGADASFSTSDNSVYIKTYDYNNDDGYTIEDLYYVVDHVYDSFTVGDLKVSH